METTNTSSCFSISSSQSSSSQSQPEAEAVPESKKRVREEVEFFPLTTTLNKALWEEQQKYFKLNEAHKQLRAKYDLMKQQLIMLLAEKKQSQSQMTLPMTVVVETVRHDGNKCVYYVKQSSAALAAQAAQASVATSATASVAVSSQTK